MKILIISNLFPPEFIGGYELGTLDIADELSGKGHSIHVVTSDYFKKEFTPHKNYEISRILDCTEWSKKQNRENNYVESFLVSSRNLESINRIVSAFQPEVVILFNLRGLGLMGVLKYFEFLQIKTILYLMGDIFSGIELEPSLLNRFKKASLKFNSGSIPHLVTMSRTLKTQVSKNYSVLDMPSSIIPGWVKNQQSNQLITTSPPSEKTKFIFASRISSHKGVDIILDAVKKCNANISKNWEIDFYGDGEVDNLLEKIRTLNLSTIINYKGSLPKKDLVNLFAHYDSLLFPTWHGEAFGFVVVEAMSKGCVPIITVGIGASEFLEHRAGCIFIERTSESLLDAMQEFTLLEHAQKLDLKMKSAEIASKTFAADLIFRKIDFLLDSMKEVNSCPYDKKTAENFTIEMKNIELYLIQLPKIDKVFRKAQGMTRRILERYRKAL